jgi:hypothetical protein
LKEAAAQDKEQIKLKITACRERLKEIAQAATESETKEDNAG